MGSKKTFVVDGEEVTYNYTDKQLYFVEHYLRTLNATQAAKDAKYSERTAAIIGWENLQKPNIKALISLRMGDIIMGANEVLFRLARIARVSLEDISDVDDFGRIKFNFKKAQRNGAMGLIKSVTPTAHGTKIELHDPHKAIVDVGKHLQLFTNNIDIKSDGKRLENTVIVYLPDNDRE